MVERPRLQECVHLVEDALAVVVPVLDGILGSGSDPDKFNRSGLDPNKAKCSESLTIFLAKAKS